jgi:hypothetical protein
VLRTARLAVIALARAALGALLILLPSAQAQAQPTAEQVDQAGTASANANAGEPSAPRLLVLETQVIGIDEVVGRFVDRALRRSAESQGFVLLPPGEGQRALQAMGAAYPPSMADLWRATYATQAERGVFAVAWASEGRYVVQVRVASRDGGGPAFAQGDADSAELEQRVEALFRQALSQALPAMPSQLAARSTPSQPPVPAPIARPATPVTSATVVPATAHAEPRHLRLALHEELAFGLAQRSFFNDVLGGRFDLQLGGDTWLGAYGGYADLDGRHGRVRSVLLYAQLEQRIAVIGRELQVPLRFDLGYLVNNGGFLRLSSGLSFALGEHLELVLDLLAPTFWSAPSRSLFSLDLGAELCVTL